MSVFYIKYIDNSHLCNYNHIIFSVFFSTFRASGVPHIHFFNFTAFTSHEVFEVFAPIARLLKLTFVNFAEKFSG